MTPVRAGVALLIELQRQAWNMQMEIARLRAPEQIRDRVERMDLRVGATFEHMLRADTTERRFAANNR